MAKTNDTNKTEEIDELPVLEDAVLEIVPELVDAAAVVPAAPAVKRALGVKEPIEFKWKVVGGANGMILTLFKSVELPDAEAQLERLQKEGYYADLRLLEASVKIEQPPQPKGMKKPAPRAESAAPAKGRAATPVPTVPSSKKPAKAAPPPPPPPPPKKSVAPKASAKPAAKPAKKKGPASTSSKKHAKAR